MKSKSKRSKRKETHFIKKEKTLTKKPPICYRCDRTRHFSYNCKMKWKINNLEIDESNLINSIKENLKDLLLNFDLDTSNNESRSDSTQGIGSFDGEICVITKKQDLLLDFIDKI